MASEQGISEQGASEQGISDLYAPPTDTPVLYWVNGSIPSWQVMWAALEKGLRRGEDFEARRLRVMGQRETRDPAFLALNPRGQAPAWSCPDGAVITESLAILHWLERAVSGPALLPDDPRRLAVALSWMYEVERLRAAYRPLEALFLDPAARTTDQIEAARRAPAAVAAELSVWAPRVAEGPWLLGEALTLADCVFYPALAYQVRRGLTLAEWPALSAYVRRVEARPQAQQARPEGWHKRPKRSLFAEAAAR